MSMIFSTKARTLFSLKDCFQSARFAPLVFFQVEEWKADHSACITRIQSELKDGPWIVRSSCNREDGERESNAGAFLSVSDVLPERLHEAVEEVIYSYGKATPDDEVLVQPMLQNVIRAGVAFSHDPNTCSPYRVINWTEGDNTSAVTGGMSGRVWQQAANSRLDPPKEIVGTIKILDELLSLFNQAPVDCEFAVTRDNGGNDVLWLMQVRPLILPCEPEPEAVQEARLQCVQDKVMRGMCPHPFLIGEKTVYGVMPDWNPAEIIGVRPKPLALSLYRELVTDAIWAYQRHNYGYRNLRSFPLVQHFFGLPYVDVRLSFNSFIPNDLNDELAGKLVDYYIEQLLAEPTLHDKVEFEIVFSCYSLDLPEKLERLSEAGFSKNECAIISDSLRQLTNHIVHPTNGLWQSDAAKLTTLNARREVILTSNMNYLERIYWLIEDAKRYGTLPFAGLARVGFIAVQILRSLVATGVFSQSDYDAFIGSVTTVSGQLIHDYALLDKDEFLAHYGHLRPNTYDILSPRYDEAPDLYFDWIRRPLESSSAKPFVIRQQQMREVGKLLEAHKLHSDPIGLFDFLKAAIELRERAKFDFTRNLSDSLALISKVGESYGFSREDIAYSDIAVFKELYVAAASPKELLSNSIVQGKERYAETSRIVLPPLIVQPEDVWGFEWPETAPNFITQKQVTALVVGCDDREQLANAVVCISHADPGYDWLFAYPIAGLITAWGGANSHMAIRAGELGLPAVIGAGESLYQYWSNAKRLHLDCAGRRVQVLA